MATNATTKYSTYETNDWGVDSNLKKELVIRCNNYAGVPSEERCRTLEDYVIAHLESSYTIKDVKMHETHIEENLIYPELVIRYDSVNDDFPIIEKLDQILLEIGVSAIKAIVSEIVSRAVEGALSGGLLGLVAGGTSRNSNAALIATIIGGLIGGVIGNSIKKQLPLLVAWKEHGKWTTKKVPEMKLKWVKWVTE